MTRIEQTFATLKAQNKKALVTFITAGDPQPGKTVELMHALVEGGADILELGIPFSDPMAEGPVIQRACERALANGVGIRDCFDFVREFRKTNTTTPVVLMGYANRSNASAPMPTSTPAAPPVPTARSWSTIRRKNARNSPPRCAQPART